MSAVSRGRAWAVAGWLRSASLLVPAEARAEWQRRYRAQWAAIGILESRGELPGASRTACLWLCRDAAVKAVSQRFRGVDVRRCLRSPGFAVGALAAALLLLACATHGLAVTRSLLEALRSHAGGAYSDRLFANLAPVALAVVTAGVTAVSRRPRPGPRWAGLVFLAGKTLLVEAIAVAVWLEGGAALRACLRGEALRVWIGGVGPAVAFVGLSVRAMIWSLDDQQRRCPFCLRRLVLPVRVGSWASVLEPVATEWLCDAGHGAVCLSEVEHRKPEHWVRLGA